MKRVTRTGAGLRLSSRAKPQVPVWALHHTSTVSPSSEKCSTSQEDSMNQAQTAPHSSDQRSPPPTEIKSEQSGAAKKKTVAERDEELRLKLEGMSGGGGSAGVEYEGGKAEGLKRGVKSNMFRVI